VGEIGDDRPARKSLGDALGLDHQLAREIRFAGRYRRGACRAAEGAAGLAQRLQLAHATHVALAPRRDAVADPVLLTHDLAVELVLGHLLLGQLLVAPGLEIAKADVDAPGLAAVEPHGDLRQVLQEAAVVADEDEGAALRAQPGLEPFDGRQVEVVGRLIQQQDVGRPAPARRPARRGAARRPTAMPGPPRR
jgi:hypothetical protein